MIPILFESTEQDFVTFGLGGLTDCTSCVVTEEINGIFELAMDYPIDGHHFEDITTRRIIYANTKTSGDPQPFRIYKISKPISGIVTVSARHISYDLSDYTVIPPFADESTDPGNVVIQKEYGTDPETVLNNIKSIAYPECPFTFTTDVEYELEDPFEISEPMSVRKALGSETGCVLNVFPGEYIWDKFNVSFVQQRGQDNGVKIEYGVNMTDLKSEESYEDFYTAVFPYVRHESGSRVYLYKLYDTETAPDAPLVKADGIFDFERIYPLDLSSEFSGTPRQSDLYNKALEYINNNNIGIPSVHITASFYDVSDIYGEGFFREVQIGDTVNVLFPRLGVNTTSRCIKTEFNVIDERYDVLEIGDKEDTLADKVANTMGNYAGTSVNVNYGGNPNYHFKRILIQVKQAEWNEEDYMSASGRRYRYRYSVLVPGMSFSTFIDADILTVESPYYKDAWLVESSVNTVILRFIDRPSIDLSFGVYYATSSELTIDDIIYRIGKVFESAAESFVTSIQYDLNAAINDKSQKLIQLITRIIESASASSGSGNDNDASEELNALKEEFIGALSESSSLLDDRIGSLNDLFTAIFGNGTWAGITVGGNGSGVSSAALEDLQLEMEECCEDVNDRLNYIFTTVPELKYFRTDNKYQGRVDYNLIAPDDDCMLGVIGLDFGALA